VQVYQYQCAMEGVVVVYMTENPVRCAPGPLGVKVAPSVTERTVKLVMYAAVGMGDSVPT